MCYNGRNVKKGGGFTEGHIIITDIRRAAYDVLFAGHPYIPTTPRPYHSIGLITEGSMRYTCRGRTTVLCRGEVLFIRAGSMDIAQSAEERPVRYHTVDFSTLNDDFPMETRYGPNEAHLLPLFRRLSEAYVKRDPYWMTESIGTLYSVFACLLRSENDLCHPKYRYKRIAPAVELAQQRISDPSLSASEMADACGITPTSLNRCFHSLYGTSVRQYLRDRRMERAKELLLNSSNTVGDVAKAVGFCDIYAFSHAFARIFGVSPQMWRKQPEEYGG